MYSYFQRHNGAEQRTYKESAVSSEHRAGRKVQKALRVDGRAGSTRINWGRTSDFKDLRLNLRSGFPGGIRKVLKALRVDGRVGPT